MDPARHMTALQKPYTDIGVCEVCVKDTAATIRSWYVHVALVFCGPVVMHSQRQLVKRHSSMGS